MNGEYDKVLPKLLKFQTEFAVAKNHNNSFGGYNFRNFEDILNAAKPMQKEHGVVIVAHDEIETHLNEIYVKSTVVFQCIESGQHITSRAYARETMEKKKYDSSQLTGSASSYARKYAANGLFALDDGKDADTLNNQKQADEEAKQKRDSAIDACEALLAKVRAGEAFDEKDGKIMGRLQQSYPDLHIKIIDAQKQQCNS